MDTFLITPKEPILIYGGGPLGMGLAHRLIQAGYHVAGILDINPTDLVNSPVPVFSPTDGYRVLGEVFVYVSLLSGQRHFSIVKRLRKIGFKRLLFLPLQLRSSAARTMVNIWNSFFGGEYSVSIPVYDALWKVFSRDYFVVENTNFAVAIVHKDHVYSARTSGFEDNPFGDYFKPPNGFPGYLFDFPLVDTILSSEFLDKSPYKEGVLPMLESCLFDPSEYFVELATPASFNIERGCFNILDGCHRVKFLIDKGFTGIPLRIKKSEWDMYFRESKAQALMDYCQNTDSLPLAVKHPAFIRLPIEKRDTDSEFTKLYKELYPWDNL